jgi:hypothetical protein
VVSKKSFYKENKWKPPSKKEKEEESPTSLNPWNTKACHNVLTSLLHHDDKNPKDHVKKEKVVTRILAVHPRTIVEREHK